MDGWMGRWCVAIYSFLGRRRARVEFEVDQVDTVLFALHLSDGSLLSIPCIPSKL
jgi:hypothetical protein